MAPGQAQGGADRVDLLGDEVDVVLGGVGSPVGLPTPVGVVEDHPAFIGERGQRFEVVVTESRSAVHDEERWRAGVSADAAPPHPVAAVLDVAGVPHVEHGSPQPGQTAETLPVAVAIPAPDGPRSRCRGSASTSSVLRGASDVDPHRHQ
jgi:hypothetical protein